jgi:Tfp pilus assembly protein PilF
LGVLFTFIYICGSLAKEEAALLPVAALIYEFLFFGRGSVRKHSLFYIVVFFLLGAGTILRITRLMEVGAYPYPVPVYFATQAKVIWNYIWLAFYPVHLNVDPDISPLSFSNSLFWLFFLLHALTGYALWRLRKKHPFLTFWGLWFWLNLVLSSSFFPLNDFMAEHRAYLSLFGFCACLSYGAFEIWMPRASTPIVIPFVFTFVVIFFSIATYQRNRIWNNELTLWLDTVQKSPEKIRPHINLGGAYAQRKAFDLAISEYRQVLLLNPQIAQAYGGLGICYLNLSDLVHAQTYFEKALNIDPDYADGNVGLGMVLYRRHDYPKALFYLVPQYGKRRESVQVVGMIANSYLHTRQFREAIPFLHEFIQMKPDSTMAYFDLLRSYIYSGLYEQGMDFYDRYKGKFPPPGKQWRELQEILIQKGRVNEARIIEEKVK